MPSTTHRTIRWLAGTLLAIGLMPAFGGTPEADALRARHAELAPQFVNNAFERPLQLASTQNAGNLKGEIHAVVDQPFQTLNAALRDAGHWC
ncbi:MAG TPA: hypothetical protein VGP22_06590, partial [Albitalea sp.]|nr:hypothetical protein [Albitalea sp.]